MAAELELPAWAQTAGMISIVLSTSLVAVWRNKKKGDSEEVPTGSEHRVVAASFVDATLLRELIDTMRSLSRRLEQHCEVTTQLKEVTSQAKTETERLYEHLHEEALIRSATARMLEQRNRL